MRLLTCRLPGIALLAATLAVAIAPAAIAAESGLRGDAQAIERIERMLTQLGGANAWARSRSLYLDYRVHRTGPDEALTERAWRDLREPNQRIELASPSAPFTWAFTPQGAWASRKAGVVDVSPAGHASALKDWPFDFYTILRSFAVGDDSLSLTFVPPRRVVVKHASGADYGWWEIDDSGRLLKWGVSFDDGPVEYVYGPIRDFGTVRFPAWGANVDGSWRFDYADVRLSEEPIPPELLRKPDAAPTLAGDPKAVAAVERMLERLGGRETWARARTLYVEYDGWRTRPNEPVIERAWRDLTEPRQRSEYRGQTFVTISGLSPTQGWTDRDGKLEFFDAERHRATVERYPFGFYNSLRSFAVADPRIQLAWQEPDRVIVQSTDGRERGWWQIDSTGAPIKWGAPTPDGRTVEYVYGPVRSFGAVNFPAWGASTDGWWRWSYVKVDVSAEPMTASVDPPASAGTP